MTGLAGLAFIGSSVITMGTAQAADFPFKTCYQKNYSYRNSDGNLVEARYNHTDSGRNFYKIYVNGSQPNPGNPADQVNWASCRY